MTDARIVDPAKTTTRPTTIPRFAEERSSDPYPVRAGHLLKRRSLWAIPAIIGSILLALITVFYVGSIVNPSAHLRGLPVAIVNEDAGAGVGRHRVQLGDQVEVAMRHSQAVTARLSLTPERLSGAEALMNRDGAYATVLIPRRFSASLLSLAGLHLQPGSATGKPTIEILANRRAGGTGVQLAEGVLAPAIANASHRIGREILAAARPVPAANSARAAVLADPLTSVTIEYRPLPSHSALGLSAFYVALLTLVCGFLIGVIVNTTVDTAAGYATSEIGPSWRQLAPLPINRSQTLLTKGTIALPLAALMTGVMLAVATGPMGMDAPNAGYLWLFTWLAAASVAAGTLVLLAALGNLGQPVALLSFVYLGLASAGGTVPLQALPKPFKLVSEVEPLRQILAGTRSILYFNAGGDAGLTRGIIAAAGGLIFWLVAGAAVVRWYDRRGLHRLDPDRLAYVQRAAGASGGDAQP